MKNFFLIICFIMTSICNWAQQNLVPNYSFENYTSCPPQANSIAYCTPWFQPNYPYAGLNGSSDVQHSCGGYIPLNMFTYQFPRSGNGYAGINLFWAPGIDEDNWREYIEVELTDSLKANKNYCIRFFTNKANSSSYAIKQIQTVFTVDSLLYNDTNYTYIPSVTPVLEADSIINDTLNWIPVQVIYAASGGERFMTIGNFSPGNQVDYLYTSPFNSSIGYYLFDDVSVYELPDYNAGADTTICPWDTIIIGPQSVRGDVQYSWSPSSGLSAADIANPLASPLVNTTYILTVTDTCQWACNPILTDTITINVQGCLGIPEENKANLFELFPNPASSSCVYETILNTEDSEVEIYSITGAWIQTLKLTEGYNRLDIDLSTYENGVYVFKIMINGELIETKRLVVTK